MASGAPSCLLGIRIKRNKIFNNPRPQNGKSLLGKEVFWGWRTWKNNCCDYSTKSFMTNQRGILLRVNDD